MLFKKLFNQGKNISKSGTQNNLERRKRIDLESSITETMSKIYDGIESQKQMLCDVEKFNHIDFCRAGKEIKGLQESLDVLTETGLKLFGLESKDYQLDLNLWDMLEAELKEKEKNNKQENKKDNENIQANSSGE